MGFGFGVWGLGFGFGVPLRTRRILNPTSLEPSKRARQRSQKPLGRGSCHSTPARVLTLLQQVGFRVSWEVHGYFSSRLRLGGSSGYWGEISRDAGAFSLRNDSACLTNSMGESIEMVLVALRLLFLGTSLFHEAGGAANNLKPLSVAVTQPYHPKPQTLNPNPKPP